MTYNPNNVTFNINTKTEINLPVVGIILTLLALFPQFVFGQEYNLESELEQGVWNLQNAQFKEAFPHFEKISEMLSQSGEEEVLPVIYYFCQSCKFNSGDIASSIPFGEKAINFTTIPIEYQIQVLRTLLNAYDELGLEDKCLQTIAKLKQLWKSSKAMDIIEPLLTYYSNRQEHTKVISFENDLQSLKSNDDSNDIDKISYTIQLNTIYMCMARAFSELKDYNESISYLQKCLETLTPYTLVNKSTIYLMMADNYHKIGDKKSALKYQKLAIE